MPRHTDEERSVMAIVGWPPLLRCRHQCGEVALDCGVIEALECYGVIKTVGHWIGGWRVLVKHPEAQLVWPPMFVCSGTYCRVAGVGPMHYRTLTLGVLVCHCYSFEGIVEKVLACFGLFWLVLACVWAWLLNRFEGKPRVLQGRGHRVNFLRQSGMVCIDPNKRLRLHRFQSRGCHWR